jgi:hypothetical protein
LRANGDDVAWVRELKRGVPDTTVLEWSAQQHRILLTEDFDYGELIFAGGRPAVGVVIVMLSTFGDRWENRAPLVVQRLIENQNRFEGNIAVLEHGRIKLRPLPGRSAV